MNMKSHGFGFFWRQVMRLLFRYSHPLLFFAFFLVFGYGLSVWHENAYRGEWSDEKKREYAATAFEETVLNEERFDQALEFARERSKRHDMPISIRRDYFFPKSESRVR